jgi:hypothetical protein
VSTGGYAAPINFTLKKQRFVNMKTIPYTKYTELHTYNYEEQQTCDDRLQSSDHTSAVRCTYRFQLRTLHKHHNAKCNNSILGNDQLDALFLNAFILCLYMFRAASAHHQECVIPDDVLIQFGPPDDEHLLLETCRGIK